MRRRLQPDQLPKTDPYRSFCVLDDDPSTSAEAPFWRYHYGALAGRSAQMICAHVLARSTYSQSARDRQIWAVCHACNGTSRVTRPHVRRVFHRAIGATILQQGLSLEHGGDPV
jgi:hypothetical protein